MAENNNITVWQRLTVKSFWSRFYIGPTSTPVYKFDKKELLKTPR